MVEIIIYIIAAISWVILSPFYLYDKLKVEIFNHTSHSEIVLSTIKCPANNFEWKIMSKDSLSAVNGGDYGFHHFEKCVSIELIEDGSSVFTTDSSSSCSPVIESSQISAYHDALMRTSALPNKTYMATASKCLANNLSPNGDTDTLYDFQKVLSLPTMNGSVTIFPGQSAQGTVNGMSLKLSTDAFLSPNLNAIPGGHFSYHIYVNGSETSITNVEGVLITPAIQYIDGSVKWVITYPDANGQYRN